MGKAYSQDMRLLVLRAVDSGQNKFSVHRSFGVSRSTIDDWLALRKQTGAVCPKPRVVTSRSAITDWSVFEKFAARHSGASQRLNPEANVCGLASGERAFVEHQHLLSGATPYRLDA